MAFQVTQCPRCESTFNIDPRVLDLAAGKVRCGACLSVFQAEENFVAEEREDEAEHESVFVGNAPEDFFDPTVFLTRSALQENTEIQIPDTQAPHFPPANEQPAADTPATELEAPTAEEAPASSGSDPQAADAADPVQQDSSDEPPYFEPAQSEPLSVNPVEETFTVHSVIETANADTEREIPEQHESQETERETERKTEREIESSHLEFFAAVNESLDDVQEFDGIEDLQTIAELNAMDNPNADMFISNWEQHIAEEDASEDEMEAVLAGELDDEIEPAEAQAAEEGESESEAPDDSDEAIDTQPVELDAIRPESTPRPEEISLSVSFAVEPRRIEPDPAEPQSGISEEPQRGVDEKPQLGVNEEPQPGVVEEPQRGVIEEPQPGINEKPQRDDRDEEPHPDVNTAPPHESSAEPAAQLQPIPDEKPQHTIIEQSQDAQGDDSLREHNPKLSDVIEPAFSHELEEPPPAIPPEEEFAEPIAEEFNEAIAEDEFIESVEIGSEAGSDEESIDMEIGEPDEEDLEQESSATAVPVYSETDTENDTENGTVIAPPMEAASELLEDEQITSEEALGPLIDDDSDADTDDAVDTSTEAIRARARAAQYQDDDALEAIPQENLRSLGTITPPVELIAGMPKSWGKNIVLAILCLLLGAALAGQYAWQELDRYAQEPVARTVFEWLCSELGCTIPAYSNIDAIASNNLTVRSHPERDDALVVAVEMRNTAPFPQAFPIMVLSFNSSSNQLIALREFYPEEYLDPGLREVTMMPVMSPVQVSLEIIDPGGDAVNYTMAFRLP